MFFLHHTVYLCVENIFFYSERSICQHKASICTFFYSGCLWPLFLCIEYIAYMMIFRFQLREGWMVPTVLKKEWDHSLVTHVLSASLWVYWWIDSSHPILRHISAGNVPGISWESKSKIKILDPTWIFSDCDSSVLNDAKNDHNRISLCFTYLVYIPPQNKLLGVRKPSLVNNLWWWNVLSHLLYYES